MRKFVSKTQLRKDLLAAQLQLETMKLGMQADYSRHIVDLIKEKNRYKTAYHSARNRAVGFKRGSINLARLLNKERDKGQVWPN
jgi:hypothetical protein